MIVAFADRTAETVREFFLQAQAREIKENLPLKAKTVEEALLDYQASLLPGATSYGKVILADDNYIGDIWCYCIDKNDEPNAMISYCIFHKKYLSRGIATKAVGMFLKEVQGKFGIQSMGAFTYSSNIPSIRVLEKNRFTLMEEFVEDGVRSRYYQYSY